MVGKAMDVAERQRATVTMRRSIVIGRNDDTREYGFKLFIDEGGEMENGEDCRYLEAWRSFMGHHWRLSGSLSQVSRMCWTDVLITVSLLMRIASCLSARYTLTSTAQSLRLRRKLIGLTDLSASMVRSMPPMNMLDSSVPWSIRPVFGYDGISLDLFTRS